VIQNRTVIAAGPTTSARMNACSKFLIDEGVKALIGKGGMGREVAEQLFGRGVYLAFTGGCAALAASRMQLKGVYFEDLGMAEAVWEIELDRLPLVVGIDSRGGDLFDQVMRKASMRFHEMRRPRSGA
jgi:fumarate hydratase subunit beta